MVYAIKYLFLLGLVNCYSASRDLWSISGKVCLKTAIEFPDKCSFTVHTAQEYFKIEQDICHRKCSVAIYSYTDNGYTLWNLRYSLRTTTVIFSNESVTYNTCPNSSYPRDSYMHVTCSTWKHDEYLISKVYNCQERDAYCSRIGNTCICQCFSGYNIINDHCLLANVQVGYPCSSDLQCNGTNNSGVCTDGFCQCQLGYLQINKCCYPGNVPMNQFCIVSHQCSDFPDSVCLEGRCKCKDKYRAENVHDCVTKKASVGGVCTETVQCVAKAVCSEGRCACRPEDIFIDDDCYRRDVFLNQTCMHSHQCSTSPYAACLEGRCKCIDGYKAKNDRFCEKGKSSYGGFCSQSDECTHSTVCKNERCTCKQGFVFINSDCHEILPLNRSCVHDMQCARSLYAVCSNGKCDCIAGYKAENSSDCVLGVHQEVFDQHQDAQGSKSVHVSTVGILFGGFFLGVFFTAGFVFIIYRKFKFSGIKRTEPSVLFTEKVYSLAKADEFIQSGPSSPQNTMREVINIAPHKPPEYSYVSHKPQRQPRNEDIYNHLNEKEEREDSNNYDHACAATFDIGDSSLYNKVKRKMHIPIFPEEMNADINGYSTVKL
uniref:Protein draper-like n=1 Tax=Crassostrea virginica TaxID=6565 RepID=A0A8B8B262_CRAVI|nr:protein draper-like [Crassostrea virginica]